MNVLIVDDEPLARNEVAYLLEKCQDVVEIKEADSIDEAMGKLIDYSIDLIFLDIHLTNESGLSLANKLKTLKHPPMIIFATAYDDYAIKAFELDAVDYVLKPFELTRVQQAVRKAAAFLDIEKTTEDTKEEKITATLPVQSEERIYIIKLTSIVAISVESGKTTIYTEDQALVTHDPLNAWEKKLKKDTFLRVHRSFLINTRKIKEIQPWFNHTYQLTMSNQLKVPVSRSYMKEFKEKLGIV